jgi:hypothetical protein
MLSMMADAWLFLVSCELNKKKIFKEYFHVAVAQKKEI